MRRERDSGLAGRRVVCVTMEETLSGTILATFMRHESYSRLAGHVPDTLPVTFTRHESYPGLAGRASGTILATSFHAS